MLICRQCSLHRSRVDVLVFQLPTTRLLFQQLVQPNSEERMKNPHIFFLGKPSESVCLYVNRNVIIAEFYTSSLFLLPPSLSFSHSFSLSSPGLCLCLSLSLCLSVSFSVSISLSLPLFPSLSLCAHSFTGDLAFSVSGLTVITTMQRFNFHDLNDKLQREPLRCYCVFDPVWDYYSSLRSRASY